MPGTPHIAVREDLWPIVVYTVTDGASDDEWQTMFGHYALCYKRATRFCPITDVSQVTRVISPGTRHLIARLAKEHELHSRRWILESTAVIRNPVVRGARPPSTGCRPPRTLSFTSPRSRKPSLARWRLSSVRARLPRLRCASMLPGAHRVCVRARPARNRSSL